MTVDEKLDVIYAELVALRAELEDLRDIVLTPAAELDRPFTVVGDPDHERWSAPIRPFGSDGVDGQPR